MADADTDIEKAMWLTGRYKYNYDEIIVKAKTFQILKNKMRHC